MTKSTRPLFLTKQQRQEQEINRQYRPQVLPKVVTQSNTNLSTQDTSQPVNQPRSENRRMTKKIKFDWDPQEDTSAISESLITHAYALKRSSDSELFQAKHWSKKSLNEMVERDWRIFREDYGIAIKGLCIHNFLGQTQIHPFRSWDELDLDYDLLQPIYGNGFDNPTPIQRQCIPLGLSMLDFVGIAETGTGKTLSFLIPMMTNISKSNRSRTDDFGPFGLVLVPTRELALQIENVCSFLDSKLRTFAIIGGKQIQEQALRLRSGVDIIIGTPGRLRDCIEQRVFSLTNCNTLAVDEADKMIEMNFGEDIRFLMNILPGNRHIMMLSATMNPSVTELSTSFLRNFSVVNVGVLTSKKFIPPILIFANTKSTVDFVYKSLRHEIGGLLALHSGHNQSHRDEVMDKFRKNNHILIATDVAGRGIDVKNISLVINYDYPQTFEKYVHRLGRTGRAGANGHAITLMTESDLNTVPELAKLIKQSKS